MMPELPRTVENHSSIEKDLDRLALKDILWCVSFDRHGDCLSARTMHIEGIEIEGQRQMNPCSAACRVGEMQTQLIKLRMDECRG